jgi:hypothetical protein
MVSFCRTAFIDSKINELLQRSSCSLKDDLLKCVSREIPLDFLKEIAKESNLPLHELLLDSKIYLPPVEAGTV